MVIKFFVQGTLKRLHFISCFPLPSNVRKKGRVYNESKFRRKMRKLTLYIARYRSPNYDPNVNAISAPCVHCTRRIKNLGIKKIIYVDIDGNIQTSLSKNYNSTHQSMGYRTYQHENVKVA